MCRPASFVVGNLGKTAFWSKLTDSHEDIIKEHGLVEQVAGKITFVRVEIAPDDGILTTPIGRWEFKTDQDMLPDWYDSASAEKLCRAELPVWFESKVFIDGEHEIYNSKAYAFGDAKLAIKAGGSAVVYQGGSAEVYQGGSADVYQGGSVVVRGGSVVVYQGGLAVVQGGSVVVYQGGSAVVRGGSVVVYQGGSAVVRGGLVEVYQGGSAEGKENGTIINYTSTAFSLQDNAVCIDRINGKPVIHVAGE
jgi:hypothetical protein